VSYVAISRAPLAEIEPFRERMGWTFNWVSSSDNDFNFDYDVSSAPKTYRTARCITTMTRRRI
jgi:predicted dithiol-disulfide oxidoreductase (DUF899 family)